MIDKAPAKEERERVVILVKEGKSSEYWNIMRGFLLQWKVEENQFLDSFKGKGILKEEIDNYNRARDRLAYINRFLNINETLIEHNSTFLERAESQVSKVLKKVESFVS